MMRSIMGLALPGDPIRLVSVCFGSGCYASI